LGKKKKGPIQAVQDAPVEERTSVVEISISDPALAQYLGISRSGTLEVSESSALGSTAFYRAVSIIAGTIAGLPLKTYRRGPDDTRERSTSFLDHPAGPYPLTPFAWKELVMSHLLIQGETFLLHIYNGAGALVGLWPVHRSAVSDVEWSGTKKVFTVQMENGTTKLYTSDEMTHITGLTTDGLRGVAPLTLFRQAIQLGLAGDIAAKRSFSNGMLISGIVTPDTDMEEEEAKTIKEGLMAKMTGVENAGDIAVINRSLKFTPWSMTLEDAQFLQSREFQIIEFARMFGVPPHLLGATEKQTSWGTGVAEQNLGLARYTLIPWTGRIEEALSELLVGTKFCEFDYKGLLQGSPADEINLLIAQVKGGLLTEDEARAILNRPPKPNDTGGDSVNDPNANSN
jgi:HK97 family phage portal protein